MENVQIDFIKINFDKEKIDEQIRKLIAGEIKQITISNMPSYKFEELYDVEEVTDFNGWQCDWWSKMYFESTTLNLLGCAWYATVSITMNDDDFYDEDEDEETDDDNDDSDDEYDEDKVDAYHDLVVTVRGARIGDVLPVMDNISLKEAEELVKNGKLQKFYFWRTKYDSYTLVFAPDSNEAIKRMLAIWGDYNDLADEAELNFRKSRGEWSDDNTRCKFSGDYYVLDISFLVNLTKEETIDYLHAEDNFPRIEGMLPSDRIKEAIKKWKEDHGYANKIIKLDNETVKENLEEILNKTKRN